MFIQAPSVRLWMRKVLVWRTASEPGVHKVFVICGRRRDRI